MPTCPAHIGGDAVGYLQLKGVARSEALKLAGATGKRGIIVSKKQKEVSPKKRKIYPQLPEAEARHIYKDAEGNIVFNVLRRPKMPGQRNTKKAMANKKCLPFMKVHGGYVNSLAEFTGKYPLYKLERLANFPHEDMVLIVEGEGDADLFNQHFSQNGLAVTNIHGAGSISKTDWTPLANRKVIILSDADEPGRQHARAVADLLQTLKCQLFVWEQPGSSGNDLKDLFEQFGPADAVKRIQQNAIEYKPEAIASDIEELDIIDNEHYRIVGQTRDGFVWRNKRNKRVILCPMSRLNFPYMLTMAPLGYWNEMVGKKKVSADNKLTLQSALTEGVFRQRMVRPSELTGTGACLDPKLGPVWHLGNRILTGQNDIVELDSLALGNYYDRDYAMSYQTPSAEWEQRAEAVVKAINQYRWMERSHGMFALGWLGIALLGGMLEWRPNLWLVAGSTSGKSYLINNLFMPFLRGFSNINIDATAASLARDGASNSLPVVMDEFNATDLKSKEIMALIRASTSGHGRRLRASMKSDSEVIATNPRGCYFPSSITVPRLEAQDASRFAIVSLSPVAFDAAKFAKISDEIHFACEEHKLIDIRNGILSSMPRALELVKKWRGKIDSLQVNTRASELYSAIMAGYELFNGKPTMDIRQAIVQSESNVAAEVNSMDILVNLMGAKMEFIYHDDDGRILKEPVSVRQAVLALLTDTAPNTDEDGLPSDHRRMLVRLLAEHGFKISVETDQIIVFGRHPNMTKLSRQSGASMHDLNRLFSQIVGAEVVTGKSIRFGREVASRYVRLPLDLVLSVDKDLDDQKTTQAIDEISDSHEIHPSSTEQQSHG